MRNGIIAVLAISIQAAMGLAAEQPAVPLADVRLDALLRECQKKSDSIRDMRCEFEVTSESRTFKTKDTSFGAAASKGTKLLLWIEKDEKGNPRRSTLWNADVCHRYDHVQRVGLVGVLYPPNPHGWKFLERMAQGIRDHVTLVSCPFPFAQARTRFKLRLGNENADYAWIVAEPKTADDRASYQMLQLLIDKKTHMLSAIRTSQPNGDDISTVTFKRVETNLNPPITPELLMKELPKDGKWDDYRKLLTDEPAKPKTK